MLESNGSYDKVWQRKGLPSRLEGEYQFRHRFPDGLCGVEVMDTIQKPCETREELGRARATQDFRGYNSSSGGQPSLH